MQKLPFEIIQMFDLPFVVAPSPQYQGQEPYHVVFHKDCSVVNVTGIPVAPFLQVLKEQFADIAAMSYVSHRENSMYLVLGSSQHEVMIHLTWEGKVFWFGGEKQDVTPLFEKKWKMRLFYSDLRDAAIVEVLRQAYKMASEADTEVKAHLITSEMNSLDTTEFQITMPADAMSMDLAYGSGFAEWHKEIVSRMRSTSSGILLAHGPPGTGKTSWIRSLIRDLGRDKMALIINRAMASEIGSPQLATLLINLARQDKPLLLIIEDAEHMLLKRDISDPVGSDLVSVILNLTDGILNDLCKCQVVATFNTDIANIDPALMRKGRLISNRKFDKLSVEDSNKLLQHLNKPAQNKAMTLAEILSLDSVSAPVPVAKPNRTGF